MELFIIRWAAHGSKVDEWDYDELNKIETPGHEDEEAKEYVTRNMLCGDGLGRSDGIFGKAFPTLELARRGMKECHDVQVTNMRNAIQKCIGIDQEDYQELFDSSEIAEEADGKGEFPPCAKLISGGADTCLDTTIHWGTTWFNHEKNCRQHEYMLCCVGVSTRVTCWIEALEMVKPEPVTESAKGQVGAATKK